MNSDFGAGLVMRSSYCLKCFVIILRKATKKKLEYKMRKKWAAARKKTMNECQFHSQKKSCVVVTLNFKRGERKYDNLLFRLDAFKECFFFSILSYRLFSPHQCCRLVSGRTQVGKQASKSVTFIWKRKMPYDYFETPLSLDC